MKYRICDTDGNLGTVEYFPEEKRVEVHHPVGTVREKVRAYLNKVEKQYVKLKCYSVCDGTFAPVENLQHFDIALNQMFSRIDVHVLWGEVCEVIRTVPYDPTQSQEGVVIDKDGSIIYDDSWMHHDNEDEK